MRVASGPSPARQPSSTASHAMAARCSTGVSALRLSATLTVRSALHLKRMPHQLRLAALSMRAPLLLAHPRMASAGRPFAGANGGSSKQGSLQVLLPCCWPIRAFDVSKTRDTEQHSVVRVCLCVGTSQVSMQVTCRTQASLHAHGVTVCASSQVLLRDRQSTCLLLAACCHLKAKCSPENDAIREHQVHFSPCNGYNVSYIVAVSIPLA